MARRIDRRLRAALLISAGVALVHLIPLFLPREKPEVDLRLVGLITDPEARSQYLKPLLENPRSTAEHFYQAAQYVLPKDPALARRFLAEAERRGGAEADRRMLEARICHAERNWACVTETLNHARALLPEDPGPELVQADLAEQEGAQDVALEALSRAHARRPADVDLALRYARARGLSGDLPGALELLAKVEGALPPDKALLERGLLRLAAGDNAGAAADFEAAVGAAPKSGLHRYYLGVARYRMNDWERAEVALREASHMEGGDWRPLALLCALQRETRRLDEAAITRTLLDGRFRVHKNEYDSACPR